MAAVATRFRLIDGATADSTSSRIRERGLVRHRVAGAGPTLVEGEPRWADMDSRGELWVRVRPGTPHEVVPVLHDTLTVREPWPGAGWSVFDMIAVRWVREPETGRLIFRGYSIYMLARAAKEAADAD